MNEQALQKLEPQGESFGVMVQRAIDKGVPVETMERLLAMYEKLQAKQAKAEFDRALAAFQAECPTIQKTKKVMNKDGRSVRYQYAPLEIIVQQVKGLLEKHGFSYTVDAEVEPGLVRATCKATHHLGHSQTSSFSVPIDKDAYMNPAQQCASALTFAKRYAFVNAFGILTGDEDDDSQASHEPKTRANVEADRTSVTKGQKGATQQQLKRETAPKQATEKTREWFLAEMRKRFDDSVILQYGMDKGPPYMLVPGEHLEDWRLEYVPTTKEALQDRIEDCADFMQVPPRDVGEGTQNSLKPSESDSDRADTRAGDQNAPEGDSERSETSTDDGVETITGKLEAVSVKEGKTSNGKKWTKYGLKINGEWINSFSNTLGKLAQQDKGSMVRVQFKRGDKGCDLVGIERAKPT